MPVSTRGSAASLIDALLTGDEIARETAAARLAIRGAAAVRGLVAALDQASADGKVRILGLLEQIGGPGALGPASRLLGDDNAEVAIAAVRVVAVHVLSPDDRSAGQAVDTLTALAVDTTRELRVRTAAADALAPLDETLLAPLRAQLASVRSSPVHEADPRVIEQAALGRLPDDPDLLRRHLAQEAPDAPLTTLHRIIVVLRERETAESDAERRMGWLLCRAAAHQALASHGSRLAVYDLRETIEQLDGQVPVGFLAAMTAVGDASCLETLASTWSTTTDGWFRQQLHAAFRAIVARERLTKRHAAAKRIASHWPDAFRVLWELEARGRQAVKGEAKG